MNSIRDLLRVPRVDDDAAVQALRRARELGEDERALARLLARNVLVANEVHAVARRADEAYVRDGVERAQLVERQALVHEVDRHEVDGAEAAVNPPHELVHGRAQVLVLLDVAAGRHRELREHDAPDPLRVLREEELERVQLLRNTLDVVKAVDANDELDTLKPAL
jgi:hypothetical protein